MDIYILYIYIYIYAYIYIYIYIVYIYITLLFANRFLCSMKMCSIHHIHLVPCYMSCHESIVVVNRRVHCFQDKTYVPCSIYTESYRSYRNSYEIFAKNKMCFKLIYKRSTLTKWLRRYIYLYNHIKHTFSNTFRRLVFINLLFKLILKLQ